MRKTTECLRRKWENSRSQINVKKAQHININLNKTVKSIDGEVLKNVDNFIYFESEIESTDKEIKIRITKSWISLEKLRSIDMEITTQHNFKEELLQNCGRICFIICL